MDESAYEKWWALHVRSARGESLTDGEQSLYEHGLKQLHGQEVLAEDIESMRKARQTVVELDVRCDQLHARVKKLKDEIACLKAPLSPDIRRSLGIED